jgi:SAM-dependent methyltransferase
MSDATHHRGAWPSLIDAASAPYRQAGRFAWHFARGKLGMDPIFRHLLSRGLIPPGAQVLDIGCGQGLLASLVRAACAAERGAWPSDWAAPPQGARVTGIELMRRDVERAQAALGDSAQFICGDMRHTTFPSADTVVILDVLHYVSIAEQDEVLARVRRALRPGGLLLLRVGDAASRRGFLASQWVDRIVTFVRGHRVVPQFGRAVAQWIAQLQSLGFEVRSQPMSHGTPFANVLLIARVANQAGDAARAAAPGRLPPESAGVRAVQADAGRLGAAALTPKQGPTHSEGRSLYSAIGVSS